MIIPHTTVAKMTIIEAGERQMQWFSRVPLRICWFGPPPKNYVNSVCFVHVAPSTMLW